MPLRQFLGTPSNDRTLGNTVGRTGVRTVHGLQCLALQQVAMRLQLTQGLVVRSIVLETRKHGSSTILQVVVVDNDVSPGAHEAADYAHRLLERPQDVAHCRENGNVNGIERVDNLQDVRVLKLAAIGNAGRSRALPAMGYKRLEKINAVYPKTELPRDFDGYRTFAAPQIQDAGCPGKSEIFQYFDNQIGVATELVEIRKKLRNERQ